MLQIIGWLGCVMLAVKLLEISANPAYIGKNGKPLPAIFAPLIIGWAAVFGFALWLFVQGSQFEGMAARSPESLTSYTPLSPREVECINNAKTDTEILACGN